MKNCFVIAEAGVNHNGSEELAIRLVEVAAASGADAVKFQTFRAESLVVEGTKTAEYQQQLTGIKDQYEMIRGLELSEELHYKLSKHCKKCDIEFMSTPFDIDSAKFLVNLGMDKLKVPSGEVTNLPFLSELAGFNKPIILSTGMSSLDEVSEAVSIISEARVRQGFTQSLEEMLTILHCTSNYPAEPDDVNLRAMITLEKEFGLPVGYSDHTDGSHISIAAVSLGASIIEKHFTIDRNLPGPDHKASLEPDELKLMINQIRNVESCLGDGVKEPRKSELPVRDLVRRSLILRSDKNSGDILKSDDIVVLRPGTGIAPKYLEQVIGKSLLSSQKAGSILSWENLS